MVNQFADVFREYLYLMHPDYEGDYKNPFADQAFLSKQAVSLTISVESEETALTTDTDESYSVTIQKAAGRKVGDGMSTRGVNQREGCSGILKATEPES
jgi:hypothetical protein